jgi:RNA polymerase sigma factor (TIGR02999 family)
VRRPATCPVGGDLFGAQRTRGCGVYTHRLATRLVERTEPANAWDVVGGGGSGGSVGLSVPMGEVTRILSAVERGDANAAGELLPLVYDELRRLAAHKMAQEAAGQTLQPTALVHEAYLRLVGDEQETHWDGRRHFFAAAAEAMRRILVDNARRKQRDRHGGGRRRVELPDLPAADQEPDDLLALDDALAKLAGEDPAAAEVVKLRLYAGLSVEEAAEALGLSRPHAYRHWTYARAWLRAALSEGAEGP